jgi:predicted ATPase with chaperone activity
VNKIFILKLNNKYYNAQMNTKHIREYCALDDASKELLKTAIERLNLSARAYDRILKVARTIADLDDAPPRCSRSSKSPDFELFLNLLSKQ